MRSTSPAKPQPPTIKVRPDTKRKVERIARVRRWTLTETVDALADEFIERYGLGRKHGSNAAAQATS